MTGKTNHSESIADDEDDETLAKNYKLSDLFTREELISSVLILAHPVTGDGQHLRDRLIKEIIKPAMPRIKKTTDKLSEHYLSYLIEYGVRFGSSCLSGPGKVVILPATTATTTGASGAS